MAFGNFPPWLHALSVAWIVTGVTCAGIVAADEAKYPQRAWIMNLVWPLTTLFGTVIWLAAYWTWGRNIARDAHQTAARSFPVAVIKGTNHCGAGCTLGDIIVEWAALVFPTLAVWFGWHSIFAEKTFAVWILDFVMAFALGIVFQYFGIKAMQNLSIAEGLRAALKADIASITAWQIGMYGLMAIIQFLWFRSAYGGTAPVDSPEFWFAMQLAMLAGFATSYPINWWLIRTGVKEKM
ncbi:DUF4396 domain-containing protein [Burkholderia pseudomultivorans]|uniref:DUF4396 domain-containing protein n=1 Tax=Burkholderia pseudomultivorans TaxID=1207504 RepID=A0ABU2EEE8_9BURK|nr:DUF4396 domain-containing protein [Burkholderia pseudomultivorans]MDR8732308.1 hypothetical protein [Burkholderia pseudomultivorans]MDR8734999.1 hypothetical protein [Burkholderia pseudomultivorans]MDR8741180.1 hypothetical protein [Burkholderia pseudomultivorans]MDR8758274.1 hypothetical protein [Burkholderia pseudomultivorans]MDR8777379.1 hypothetical protein [Burkholderia pseudomultivorans]